jgi:hypothetical protein
VPHVAVFHRPDGAPWPAAVLAVKTSATVTTNVADLTVEATSIHVLSVAIAALDTWATAHRIPYDNVCSWVDVRARRRTPPPGSWRPRCLR